MLIGKQVIAVVNFAPRKIADVESQCLVLGLNSAQGVIVLTPERPAENGERVF
jgi:tRNA-binding protein